VDQGTRIIPRLAQHSIHVVFYAWEHRSMVIEQTAAWFLIVFIQIGSAIKMVRAVDRGPSKLELLVGAAGIPLIAITRVPVDQVPSAMGALGLGAWGCCLVGAGAYVFGSMHRVRRAIREGA
jgi:hypothetical protein